MPVKLGRQSPESLSVVGGITQAKNVDLSKVDKKIHIESMVDRITEDTSGKSLSVGDKMGYSVNNAEQNSDYVARQSGIYAENDLKIDVDHISLKGGVISGTKEHEGIKANLQIKANKLSSEDIKSTDHRYSESVGGGFQGITINKPESSGGKVSMNGANNGHHREQIAMSTIGEGNVEIGGSNDLGELNRDI